MNLVIGIGGAGKNVLNHIIPTLKASVVEHLYINNDLESLTAVDPAHRLIFNEVEFSLSNIDFNPILKSQLLQKLDDIDCCIVICGLGGSCANALPPLIRIIGDTETNIHLVVFSPFQFEEERTQRSKAQLQNLLGVFHNLSSYKKIDLNTHPRRNRQESLVQLLDYIACDVELYVLRNLEGKRYAG